MSKKNCIYSLGIAILFVSLSLPAQIQQSNDGEACLLGSGDLRIDIATCSRAIADAGTWPDHALAALHAARGRAYHYTRQPDNALDDLNEAIRLYPLSALAFNIRGLVHHAEGRYAQALADYDKALALYPHYAETYRNRGMTHYFQGDNDKARAALDLAIANSRYEPESAAFRGFLNYQEQRFAAAAADFQRVEAQAYPYPYSPIWLYLAQARAGQGNAAETLQNATDALNEDDWPWALIQFFLGNASEETALAAARQVPPPEGSQLHQAYFYLGQYYLLNGDRDAARDAFRAVLDFSADDPVLTVEAFNARLELAARN